MAQRLVRPALWHLSNIRQPILSSTRGQCCASITYCSRKGFLHTRPLLVTPVLTNSFTKNFDVKKYSTEKREPPRPWTDISFTQLMSGINSKNIQLFDVRTAEEVNETGMMPGATNIPLSEFVEAFGLPDDEFESRYGVRKPGQADENVVTHCLMGVRSRKSVQELHAAGYFLARHFPGGWQQYVELKNTEDPETRRPWTDINHKELMSLIKSKDIQLIDVRTVGEVENTGMMPGATNVPLDEVENAFNLSPTAFKAKYGVDMPSKDDDDVVLHCLAGFRSLRALKVLWEAGYHSARHYPGGWDEYTRLRDS